MIFPRYRSIPMEQLPPLPVSLKSAGYYYAPKNWSEVNDGKFRSHCGMFWCKSGSAKIWINDTLHHMQADKFIYYYPFDAHFIQTENSHFEYYWLCFDGLMAVEILRSFKLTLSANNSGTPPEDLFRQINTALSDVNLQTLFKGGALVFEVLNEMKRNTLTERTTAESRLVSLFRQIVQEEFCDRSLNLTAIAAKLKCHRTTLTRVVKQQLRIMPSYYLQHIRMQEALELLNNSNFTAAEISDMCGFATPEYFSRKFRQLTGKPPHRYRNHR